MSLRIATEPDRGEAKQRRLEGARTASARNFEAQRSAPNALSDTSSTQIGVIPAPPRPEGFGATHATRQATLIQSSGGIAPSAAPRRVDPRERPDAQQTTLDVVATDLPFRLNQTGLPWTRMKMDSEYVPEIGSLLDREARRGSLVCSIGG